MTIPRFVPVPAVRRAPARRVILVVADGLRPDVVPLLDLPVLGRLVRQGASTLAGRTVRPSVTAAAMASLLTGVDPAVHGLTSDHFRVPRPTGPVAPLPGVLKAAGVPASAWMARLPWAYRRLGRALVRRLGFDSVACTGDGASDILRAARSDLAAGREGLCVMHWPDADRAGHARGWPSPAYLRAVRWIDHCLGELESITGASTDPDTVLIVLADHGGGGRTRRDHNSDHPLDRTIPIIVAGGGVRTGPLFPGASLLDVPPTVLHSLGVPVPESYCGRVLHEAFVAGGRGGERVARHRRHVVEAPVPFAAAG